MWDLVPWSRIKPGPLYWQMDSHPLCHQGSPGYELLCTIFSVDMLPFLLGIYQWKKFFQGKIPWRREWQPTPVFLPGEFHGQRSLVSYSPWSHTELDTTEQLTHTHTHTRSIFNFEKNWQAVFQSDYHFIFPLVVYEGSSFSTFIPILVIICLLIVTILVDVKCYFIVVLLCISLKANDVEYLFLFIGYMYTFFWRNGPLPNF